MQGGDQCRFLPHAHSSYCHAELKHLLSLVPLLVAVTGRVWAAKPLKCELSEGEGAIVEVRGAGSSLPRAARAPPRHHSPPPTTPCPAHCALQLREDKKSERRAGGVGWLPDTEPLREVVREAEWALVDESGPFAVQLPVVDGRRARNECMQTSGEVFLPATEGLVETVVNQLSGLKNLGVRRTERVLPLGVAVTAIGELRAVVDHPGVYKGAVRAGGQMLALQAPQKGPFLLTRRRLPELVASVQGASAACGRLALVFFGAGASMLLAVAAHRAWVTHREEKARRRVEGARARRARDAPARRSSSGAAGGGASAAAAAGGDAAVPRLHAAGAGVREAG